MNDKINATSIDANQLCIGYDDKIIVKDFDIHINRREITTLIGPNGCGKSTILKALTRILRYNSGTVCLDGNDIHKMPTRELAQKISILSQHQNVPADITVEELVSYGRTPYQKWYESDSTEDERIAEWAMKAAAIYHMKDRNVNSLSGGERQRAWIATALAQDPKFLFLDEPTTFLDIAHQMEVMNLVKKLNEEFEIGVIMVLHDIEQAMEVSDQIVVIRDGRKYAQGRPVDVITSKMIQDVYNVKSKIIPLPNRRCPVITFDFLAAQATFA